MKFIKQTKFHIKDVSKGNCQQAAVASIFGLELDEVPNFIDYENFWGEYHKFINSKGYIDISVEENTWYNGYYDCNYLA